MRDCAWFPRTPAETALVYGKRRVFCLLMVENVMELTHINGLPAVATGIEVISLHRLLGDGRDKAHVFPAVDEAIKRSALLGRPGFMLAHGE